MWGSNGHADRSKINMAWSLMLDNSGGIAKR